VRADAISFLREAIPRKFPGIETIPTTETEIKIIIHSLKAKNLTDYDGTTNKFLKVCAALISHPLTHICNDSLFTILNISVVRQLYKKGDETSMSNYRPVSLLTIFSKVLEKVMHNRLSHYCQINSILVSEQFGFRKGMSIENATFRLTESILKSIKKN
jgi:hypothetical protein